MHPVTNDNMNLSEVIVFQVAKKNLILAPHGLTDFLPQCVGLLFHGFGVFLRFDIWSFVLSTIFREELPRVVSGAEILPPVGEKRI